MSEKETRAIRCVGALWLSGCTGVVLNGGWADTGPVYWDGRPSYLVVWDHSRTAVWVDERLVRVVGGAS